MLLGKGLPSSAPRVKEIVICDSQGIIYRGRQDLDVDKRELAALSNPKNKKGQLQDAIAGMDVFVGVSIADQVTGQMVRSMGKRAIVLAMANPTPEIMPDIAKEAGAVVVGTGRSDYPNQVNNALAFPGIFRGAIDAHAAHITPAMCLAAAQALAGMISSPSADKILPPLSDRRVAPTVAKAVMCAVKS
jgi:malate dehydrogenase (oxaloacetate-decarboxylating)